MNKLTWTLIVTPMILIGCSEGFKTSPTFEKKVSGTGYTGGSTGYGTTGGTTSGTTSGGTTSGGTSGGTTSGTTSGGTTGSACTAGSKGTPPDLGGLVSTFQSSHGSLINADCSTGSRTYITQLVQFLRGQGYNRVGFAGGMSDGDKVAYLWDNGSCEGNTNTTVMDVVGGWCTSSNAQWMPYGNNAPWTLTPPSNGSPETGGTTGGTTSGGTSGGTVNSPPDEEDVVDAVNNANPGMINDCTGIPIVNNFLLTVVRELQKKDPRWGFMKKESPFRIPRDILAYRKTDEGEGTHQFFVIDFVSSGCNNWPGLEEYDDPATNAGVYWNLTNPDGYAGNGTWSFDP
jgi:hypothetical protein